MTTQPEPEREEAEAPPERVFDFLSDLHNHWRLDAHFVEVEHVDPDGDGGRVRLRGPFALGRTVRTRVEEAVPSSRLRGRADIGGGTNTSVIPPVFLTFGRYGPHS